MFIIALTPLIAGLYGVIHDQLTYTISPEYYTKFKFYQFGLVDANEKVVFSNPRIQVSVVGFLATWWMGLPIGLILGLVGWAFTNEKNMIGVTLRAMIVTMAVAFVTGLAGLAYGKFYLAETGVSWWLPDDLADTKNFIAVGSMHNFSYLGGLVGLVAGIVYSRKKGRRAVTVVSKSHI